MSFTQRHPRRSSWSLERTLIGSRRVSKSLFKLFWIIAFSVVILFGFLTPIAEVALGQSALPSPIDSLKVPSIEAVLPASLERLKSERVHLDGRTIFSVTSADGLKAADRASMIAKRLSVIARQLSPTQTQVTWKLDPTTQLPIVSINNQALMTVTQADAQLLGLPKPDLRAKELVPQLEQALEKYHQERQPRFLWKQGAKAAVSLALLLAVSFVLSQIQSALYRQYQETDHADQILKEDESSVNQYDLLRNISRRQYLNAIGLKRWFARIGQALIWGGGILFLLNLFPYSRQLCPALLKGLRVPLQIIAIIFTIYALIRFGHVLIDRLLLVIQDSAIPKQQRSRRVALRFSTLSGVTKNVIATLLIAVGFIAILSLLGLDLGPLLAGAGIISLALSFASQNVIKDVINGFLILIEDQFGVGDVIICGDVSGFVENMNLRITQLRNEEGRLITIPNSAISIVQNLSNEWSRVDLMIPVALNSDINQAIALIEEVAENMRHSPDWSQQILEPPLVLGVDHLDHVGATVRLWIKTLPLKQWDVAREYRRRLKLAFDEAHIEIGMPQQSLSFHQGNGQSKGLDFSQV